MWRSLPTLSLVLLLGLSTTISSCSNQKEQAELEEVKQELEALKKQIANSTIVEDVPEIKEPNADDVAFDEAKADGRVRAYGKYAKDFEDGKHLSAADEGAWASAKRQNSVAAYKAYRLHFPDGKNVNQSYLETHDVQSRLSASTLADLGYDIDDFPSFGISSIGSDDKIVNSESLSDGQHSTITKQNSANMRENGSMTKGFKDCDFCPEMVRINGSNYLMGDESPYASQRSKPVHQVYLKTYYVSKFEITVGQFEIFVSETRRQINDDCEIANKTGNTRVNNNWNWKNPSFVQNNDYPVVCISWADAKAYTQWLSRKTGKNFRLLSESEWEYMTRVGGNTKFPWGNKIGVNKANCGRCESPTSKISTVAVGSYSANSLGVYDTIGNAWEWVEDCWNENYAGAPNDGTAWKNNSCEFHPIRGGSWAHTSSDWLAVERQAKHSTTRANNIGFRIARDN